jgi:hypothetical protein
MNQFSLFVSTMVLLDIVGLLLTALLIPPASAQLGFLATIVLAPVLAFFLAYRGGFEALGLGGLVD